MLLDFVSSNIDDIRQYATALQNEQTSSITCGHDVVCNPRVFAEAVFELYLLNQIGEWETEYLLLMLEFSDTFDENEPEYIQEIIFNLSSPILGYGVSKSNIKKALSIFRSPKDVLVENWFDVGDRSGYEFVVSA